MSGFAVKTSHQPNYSRKRERATGQKESGLKKELKTRNVLFAYIETLTVQMLLVVIMIIVAMRYQTFLEGERSDRDVSDFAAARAET